MSGGVTRALGTVHCVHMHCAAGDVLPAWHQHGASAFLELPCDMFPFKVEVGGRDGDAGEAEADAATGACSGNMLCRARRERGRCHGPALNHLWRPGLDRTGRGVKFGTEVWASVC